MKKFTLTKEISVMFIVKLAIITFLWWLCFSHPIEPTLNPTTMAAHLFT